MKVDVREDPSAWIREIGPRGAALLAEASGVLGLHADENALLRDLVRFVVQDFCDWVVVYLLDRDAKPQASQCAHHDSRLQGDLETIRDVPPTETPFRASPVHQVARTGRGQLHEELGAAFSENGRHRSLLRKVGDASGCVVPIRARGRILGVLVFQSARRRLAAADVALGDALGRQVGMALDNARLLAGEQQARQAAEEGARRLALLQRVTAALSEAVSLQEVAQASVEEIRQATGAFAAALYLREDAKTDSLACVAQAGYPAGAIEARLATDASSPVSDCLRHGAPVFLQDLTAETRRYPARRALDARAGHKAKACFPILLRGVAGGVLRLSFREPREFNQEDRLFMAALARQCSQALERARLFEAESTARAAAETAAAALRVGERRFRTLIEQFPLSTTVFAADGRAIAANLAWEKMSGRPRASLEGYNLLADAAIMDGPHGELVRSAFAGAIVNLPVSAMAPETDDAPRRWVRSLLFPVKDESGAPREVVLVVEDVTGSQEAGEAVRESEARYRLLADHSLDMIARLDVEGRILYVSPACRRLLGFDPGDLVGRNVHELLDPEDADLLPPALASLLEEGDTFTVTYRGSRHDGSHVWLEMSGRAVRDAEGRILEIVTVSRDVTERKKAELELETSRRQVARSEKLSALGSLVSGVAHEVRTPLAYLSNNLHIIRQRLDKAARAGQIPEHVLEGVLEASTEALEGAERINLLVRDLGRFTKQPTFGTQEAGLDKVVAEAVRLFRATHRGEVNVEADLRATPPLPLARAQVQQVVLNLLENAADAMGRRGLVRVATRPSPEGGILVVEDHGPGVTPEIRRRMWDPFFTTKLEGTGLGLSIVKRIVDDHQALITCESSPDWGTRFTIAFPRAKTEALPAPRTRE